MPQPGKPLAKVLGGVPCFTRFIKEGGSALALALNRYYYNHDSTDSTGTEIDILQHGGLHWHWHWHWYYFSDVNSSTHAEDINPTALSFLYLVNGFP